jgi:hypothetical protein
MQVILTPEEYDALKGDKKKHAAEGMEVFLKALGDAMRWRTESEWGVAPARSYVTVDDLKTAVSKARGAFDVWTMKM